MVFASTKRTKFELKMLFAHWLRYNGISFRCRLVVVFVRGVYFVFLLSPGRIRIPNGEQSLNLKDYNYTWGFRMEQRSPISTDFIFCSSCCLSHSCVSATWSGAGVRCVDLSQKKHHNFGDSWECTYMICESRYKVSTRSENEQTTENLRHIRHGKRTKTWSGKNAMESTHV